MRRWQAVGLPLNEFLPYGREAQSMAFLSTPGIERLYSGVTISTPSAASISPLRRVTDAGGFGSWSWLNSGRSSILRIVNCAPGPGQLGQRLGQLAVDGLAAKAADNHGDLGHGGSDPYVCSGSRL
jgi:hypothetical protein